MTNGFDLGHDLDIWIFKVKCDLEHLVTKVRCKDLPDSDRGVFRCRRAVDSSSLTHVPLVSHICIGELGQHLVQVKACGLFGAKTLLEP